MEFGVAPLSQGFDFPLKIGVSTALLPLLTKMLGTYDLSDQLHFELHSWPKSINLHYKNSSISPCMLIISPSKIEILL